MINKSYLDFANAAIQKEKEEKYDLAAEYWGKAKNLATTLNTQLWAEYRQLHNEKRHSLHNSYSKVLRTNENKRTASELKKHMKKQAVNNDCI
ncbi:ANR family transcriptional regulator [Xenorhabdus griffiniae]|uniref:ANR family transcriptional regulator n=1 Tax=Xenorhabdus griffiniae TaxID=351672 RepID=A0ABY9XFK7_9GAMM|nr:ANR family transcriptional regulator [Xenorhabdus griffiniae]MBD1227704.1 ANR family transcriptional regulator [Xenorhabdus griffiniae]MBE8587025.1 ANR family transcriptional regulator [Xenorhabdus griffiniae]WMV71690.1 ANR family transcriptional regulator [Xenorhabdus griffiniae]WNH01367.1 ANR family transcriptional regulator [Xenorhabdus griffiniae]